MKINWTKFARQFFTFFAVTTALLWAQNALVYDAAPAALAADAISVFDRMIEGSGLQNFAGRVHQLSSPDPGADVITSIIFLVIDFIKYLLGAVAVVFMVLSGYNLVTAEAKVEEVKEKEKNNLKYIIYGLIFVIIADELVTRVFFGDYGECLASATNAAECGKVGSSLFKGLYSFMLAMMGSFALFILVLSGFRLITSSGEEEVITKQKKRVVMAMIGLIIVAIGEFVVKGVVFRQGGTKPIDAAAAQKLVLNFTNFVAAFIAASAFAMLIYGGVLYLASFGNEEKTGKAKKIVIGAVIGILIAFAAFGLVTTVVTFTGR